MQSMASLMSTNNNSDIAPLDDFDEEDDGKSLKILFYFFELVKQLQCFPIFFFQIQ